MGTIESNQSAPISQHKSCCTKTRTVWVVNRSAHDFSKAERFGRLEFLSEGMLRKRNVSYMARKFSDSMKSSSPDDFLLPTSLTIMSMIAALCFFQLHGRVNLLIFDDGKYVSRTITFNEKE